MKNFISSNFITRAYVILVIYDNTYNSIKGVSKFFYIFLKITSIFTYKIKIQYTTKPEIIVAIIFLEKKPIIIAANIPNIFGSFTSTK